MNKVRTEIEKCLEALEDIKSFQLQILSANEIEARKLTYEQCLGFIDKYAEQEPKWIPVSERLPKSSGVYIVSRWFSDGEESAILTDANYYDGNGDWYNDNRINWGRDLVTNKIVAWMPLPIPYSWKVDLKTGKFINT